MADQRDPENERKAARLYEAFTERSRAAQGREFSRLCEKHPEIAHFLTGNRRFRAPSYRESALEETLSTLIDSISSIRRHEESTEGDREARRRLQEFLRELRRSRQRDFDALCREHQQIAPLLQRLKDNLTGSREARGADELASVSLPLSQYVDRHSDTVSFLREQLNEVSPPRTVSHLAADLRDFVRRTPGPHGTILCADFDAGGLADSSLLARQLEMSEADVCVAREEALLLLEEHFSHHLGQPISWNELLAEVDKEPVPRALSDTEVHFITRDLNDDQVHRLGSWMVQQIVDEGGQTHGQAYLEELRSSDPADRYVVKKELGRGGNARVVAVDDLMLRRRLAMKMLHGDDPRTNRRFTEEAFIQNRLRHPSILPVYDIGRYGNSLYFTMDLVEGKTLRDIIQSIGKNRGKDDLRRGVQILSKACRAVEFAHSQQVIHRDLKPANIFADDNGSVYVMDWGLHRDLRHPERYHSSDVRRHDDSARPIHMTQTGDIIGTPAYMPPEQSKGNLDAIGQATDVYALGATLYTLLTGHAPYTDVGAKNARQFLEFAKGNAPTPVRKLAPDAPKELVSLCERAMQRDPNQRLSSVTELRAGLDHWLERPSTAKNSLILVIVAILAAFILGILVQL